MEDDEEEKVCSERVEYQSHCSYCGGWVASGQGERDDENQVMCSMEGCNQRAHLKCIKENIGGECTSWVCDKHKEWYKKCKRCGKSYYRDCFISLHWNFLNRYGYICKECFCKDERMINEIMDCLNTDWE